MLIILGAVVVLGVFAGNVLVLCPADRAGGCGQQLHGDRRN
jgi:hypothetical protein